jgi:hypothetical protein
MKKYKFFREVLQNQFGNIYKGATVQVLNLDNSTAQIYLAADGSGGPIPSSTVLTNTDGEYSFFSLDGIYSVTVSMVGYRSITKQITVGAGYFAYEVQAQLDLTGKSLWNWLTDAQIADAMAGTALISMPAAVNQAVADTAANGDRLLVPKGIYLMDGPFKLVSNMRIRFAPGAVLLRAFQPATGVYAFVDQDDRYTDVTDIVWEGGEIRGDAAYTYSGNVFGGRLRRFRIDDLIINYYGKNGVGGRAFNFVGFQGEINRARILNPAQFIGVGGFRMLGGEDVKVRKAIVYSGDDCFQFVPTLSGPYGNQDIRRSHYEDCWGQSYAAKLCTVADTDRNVNLNSPLTNEIADVGFTRVRGIHWANGIQIDVSADTTKGIKNVTLEDVCPTQDSGQTGTYYSLQIVVTDNANFAFAGYGLDTLHIKRGEYSNAYHQALNVIDQTTTGAAHKINGLFLDDVKLGKPRSTDRTAEIQAGKNVRIRGGLIEGHSESPSVVKLGGTTKAPADVKIDARITNIGGSSIGGHVATAWGVQVFSGDAIRILSSFEPTTDYATTDARAVQVNSAGTNVLVTGSDVTKLTGSPFTDQSSTGTQLKAAANLGAADLGSPDPLRMPGANFVWDVPLPPVVEALAAPTAIDTLMLIPVWVQEPQKIDNLGIRVTTAGAGSAYKLGIWKNGTRQPTGTPVLAVNTGVATTAVGIAQATFTGVTLQKGWYWVGFVFTGTLPTNKALAASSPAMGNVVGASSSTNALPGGLTAEFAGLSVAQPYANDISTLDLTSATFTRLTAAAVPIPTWRVNNN